MEHATSVGSASNASAAAAGLSSSSSSSATLNVGTAASPATNVATSPPSMSSPPGVSSPSLATPSTSASPGAPSSAQPPILLTSSASFVHSPSSNPIDTSTPTYHRHSANQHRRRHVPPSLTDPWIHLLSSWSSSSSTMYSWLIGWLIGWLVGWFQYLDEQRAPSRCRPVTRASRFPRCWTTMTRSLTRRSATSSRPLDTSTSDCYNVRTLTPLHISRSLRAQTGRLLISPRSFVRSVVRPSWSIDRIAMSYGEPDFSCACQGHSDHILRHGRMFISEHYICFSSHILGAYHVRTIYHRSSRCCCRCWFVLFTQLKLITPTRSLAHHMLLCGCVSLYECMKHSTSR